MKSSRSWRRFPPATGRRTAGARSFWWTRRRRQACFPPTSNSELRSGLGVALRQHHFARGRNGRNGVLEDHLRGLVLAFEQHHELVERFDPTHQLDAVDEEYRYRNPLLAQGVEENVLQLIMFFGHVWLPVRWKRGTKPHLIIISRLLDFCTGAGCRDGFADALALQLLDDFAAHGLQRRQLRLARVVEADDVVAELRLDRCLGGLTLFQAGEGIGKLRYVGAAV